MSEISKINLGLPSTTSKKEVVKAEPEAKDVKATETATTQIDSKTMLGAMDAQARANAVHFGFNSVDPKKYLSPERIQEIQNSMVYFGKGVDRHAAALNEEFGHLDEYSSLGDADKLAMAAQSFAQSE